MSDDQSWTASLKVDGMHCQHCVGQVREVLNQYAGVLSVEVDLSAANVLVQCKPEVSVKDLCQALGQRGFSATWQLDATGSKANPSWLDSLGPWGRGFLTALPVFLLLILSHWVDRGTYEKVHRWLGGILALGVLCIPGRLFFTGAWHQLRARRPGMDMLVAMGCSASFLLSLWGLVSDRLMHLFWLETVGVITLISLGHWIEERLHARLDIGLKALHRWLPQMATILLPNQGPRVIPVSDLEPGDQVMIQPGEKIPTDGVIVEGTSQVDESMLTGEFRPVNKASGSTVYAATHNTHGRLKVRVTGTGKKTALAAIVRQVEKAESERAKIQAKVERISAVFVPIVMWVALMTVLAWGLMPGLMTSISQELAPFTWEPLVFETSWTAGIVCGMAVLMIACPCAMGLATPVAIMAGVRVYASWGIMVQGGKALEAVGLLDTVVFDKTGTLTQGMPQVIARHMVSGCQLTETDAKWMTHLMGVQSHHPLSRALIDREMADQSTAVTFDDIAEYAGMGLEAALGAATKGLPAGVYRLGSLEWLAEKKVLFEAKAQAFIKHFDSQGATMLGLALGDSLCMVVALNDAIRPEAHQVIDQLQSEGYEVHLMSGDRPTSAMEVGKLLGLDSSHVHGGLKPEDKVAALKRLQDAGRRVAFVGDGMNDAPVLRQAHLGISVSQASDLSRAASDMTLLGSGIEVLPQAFHLAAATLSTIRQNLFWAFFYNILAIPLAMLGWLHPMVCAATMALSDLVVIGNALRLLRRWRRKS